MRYCAGRKESKNWPRSVAEAVHCGYVRNAFLALNRKRGIVSRHSAGGFNITPRLGPGAHAVCLYTHDPGPGDVTLLRYASPLNPNPFMARTRRTRRYGGALQRLGSGVSGMLARRAIGSGIRTIGRSAFGGSGSRTRTRESGRSGVGVTTDRDFRNVYRKKWMPKRRKRQWKRFTRKVEAVAEKKRGTFSLVFNTVRRETVADNFQRMYGISLYGYAGTAVVGPDAYERDMFNIASSLKPGDSAITTEVWNRRIHFRSAVLDITFRNVHATAAVELDIYEWICKKDTPFPTLSDMVINGFTDPAASTVAGSNTLTQDDVGTTPFQCPPALRYLTILKKTKVFIPINGTATYQIRKPANRWWGTSQLDEGTSLFFAKRGWTCGLWMVQKGVPGMIAAVPARALSSDVVMSITRTYCLKTIDTQEIDTSMYVPT